MRARVATSRGLRATVVAVPRRGTGAEIFADDRIIGPLFVQRDSYESRNARIGGDNLVRIAADVPRTVLPNRVNYDVYESGVVLSAAHGADRRVAINNNNSCPKFPIGKRTHS